MLNNCTIMGRLTHDPELRHTPNGTPVTAFTLACERDFADKQSGVKETDFIDCVAWRNTAEFFTRYFYKGKTAIVSGRLQLRTWTDKDGSKRRAHEIIAESVYFGDSNKDAPNKNTGTQPHTEAYTAQPATPEYVPEQQGFEEIDYDASLDLPF